MGQYYRFYLKNSKGERMLCPFDFDNTLKLMEHSWIGNEYCNQAVLSLKDMKSAKVYHLGDYAEDLVSPEIYNKVWGGEGCDPVHFTKSYEYDRSDVVFISCPDRKEYIRYPFSTKNSDDWYCNHFAMLTALGNGREGGDYRGINPDMVGLWGGHTLKVSSKEPKGLNKIHGWMFQED